MKRLINQMVLLFVVIIFISGCNSGVTVKGRIINSLTNEPIRNVAIEVEGHDGIKTNNDGYFKIKRLDEELKKYSFVLKPSGFTSVKVYCKNNGTDMEYDTGDHLVIPRLPGYGIFVYQDESFLPIPGSKAVRYNLKYGSPGMRPDRHPSSGRGRIAAYYFNDDAVESLLKIHSGEKIIIWWSDEYTDNLSLDGIAKIKKYKSTTINGECMDRKVQAIIPEGWYIGLESLKVGNYKPCYAPIDYEINIEKLKSMRCVEGQNFTVIPTAHLLPGKYSFTSKNMDWNKSSSYAIVDGVVPEITSYVSLFEIIE
jgi:hypothetical protein